MKRTERCPKCDSSKICVVDVPSGCEVVGFFMHQPVGMAVEERFLGSSYVPVGQLESWVCTECGYLETYVKSPSTVPFEQIAGVRWVDPPAPEEGPYR